MSDAMIRTVMSIDDNALDQVLYKRVMNRSGIVENILTFQSAEDALAHLKLKQREEVDVILLDINMPCMSGFEFLEQAIKELGIDFSKMVVIMLTTSLDPSDKERAGHFSMIKAYLDKPLNVNNLKEIAAMLPQV
ncbi:MAG: response regulator [Granulosicoccus sp.]